MKTSTIVRLAAACIAALISFALLNSVATLARPHIPHFAETQAVAKVQTPGPRNGRP